MNILTFIEDIVAILEFALFIATISYFGKGLETKDYKKFKRYGLIYLILNYIRRVSPFI